MKNKYGMALITTKFYSDYQYFIVKTGGIPQAMVESKFTKVADELVEMKNPKNEFNEPLFYGDTMLDEGTEIMMFDDIFELKKQVSYINLQMKQQVVINPRKMEENMVKTYARMYHNNAKIKEIISKHFEIIEVVTKDDKELIFKNALLLPIVTFAHEKNIKLDIVSLGTFSLEQLDMFINWLGEKKEFTLAVLVAEYYDSLDKIYTKFIKESIRIIDKEEK